MHYVGALLPYRAPRPDRGTAGPDEPGKDAWPADYSKTLLITQGTVDNVDHNKLIIPALDALVLVATGGRGTDDLTARINLRTESPKPADIAKAVSAVLSDPGWKQRAGKMREQFETGDPAEVAAAVVESAGHGATV